MTYFDNSRKWNLAKQQMLVKDLQLNMEEFVRMMTRKIDFATFDILSITRTDVQPSKKQQIKHPKVDTQSTRIALQTAKIIPLPIKTPKA